MIQKNTFENHSIYEKELFDRNFILFFLKHAYIDPETDLIYPEIITDINTYEFSADITRLLDLFLTNKYNDKMRFAGNRFFNKEDLLNLLKEKN